MTATPRPLFVALLLALALPAGAEGSAEIVALTGEAWTEGPGGRQALACGDRVEAGARVVVGSDSRVGLLDGARYAQLDSNSVLRLGSGAGEEDFALEAGRLRLVDTRESAAADPQRLAAPGLSARGAGGDTEIYLLEEKSGRYAMACEWAAPLDVARPDGTEVLQSAPGECIVAKPGEPLYRARAQEERMPLAGADDCPPEPAAVASLLSNRLSPTSVAAAPPPMGLLPPAPPAFGREPCDIPGSGCFGAAALVTPPVGVVESPVTPGGLPGLPSQ